MTKPVVSVLMAVYNAEAFLTKALDSLLVDQQLTEVEVLAVDDASTDGSLALLQQRAAADARLHVFCQTENRGQAVCRNLALQHARGEYVCMVDADDWLSPDALQSAVDVFAAHPQTDCVLFRLVSHWQEEGREEAYPTEWADQDQPMTGSEAFCLSLGWRIHGLYLVRRELHQRYPYDDRLRLFSDDNTCHLHYLRSREVRLCRGTYYYRRHCDSATMGFSAQRFLHMQANLLLRQTLQEEGVSSRILKEYDRRRWDVYRGLLWLWFARRAQLNKEERARVSELFRSIYPSFSRLQPYGLFLADQFVRWRIRSLLKTKSNSRPDEYQ